MAYSTAGRPSIGQKSQNYQAGSSTQPFTPQYSDDTSWEEIVTSQPQTQADRLPLVANWTLYIISKPLESKDGYPERLSYVKNILKGCQIDAVIDSSLPCPLLAATNERHWARTSQAIISWLRDGISSSNQSDMEVASKQIIFTDRFMDVLKQLMQGTGPRVLFEAYQKWDRLSLSDSGSPTEFVRGLLDLYNDLYNREMPIPPIQAMFRLMDQLSQTEVSMIASTISKF